MAKPKVKRTDVRDAQLKYGERISLPGFGPAVSLRLGSGARLDPIATGRWRVVGKVHLDFLGRTSGAHDVSTSITVIRGIGPAPYELEFCDAIFGITFHFSDTDRFIRTDKAGPWLKLADPIRLRRNKADPAALLWTGEAPVISLIGDLDHFSTPPGLCYRRDNGLGSSIIGLKQDIGGNISGAQIVETDGTVIIETGGMKEGAGIEPVRGGPQLNVLAGASLRAELTDPGTSQMRLSLGFEGKIQVLELEGLGLEMRDGRGAGWQMPFGTRMTVIGGWATVASWSSPFLSLALTRSNKSVDQFGETGIVARQSRIACTLKLPLNSEVKKNIGLAAQFRYESPSAVDRLYRLDNLDRLEGLGIRGLVGVRDRPELLDTNRAVLDLRKESKTSLGRFRLRAGGDLDIAGQGTLSSTLGPKLDLNDPARVRRLAIATGTLKLHHDDVEYLSVQAPRMKFDSGGKDAGLLIDQPYLKAPPVGVPAWRPSESGATNEWRLDTPASTSMTVRFERNEGLALQPAWPEPFDGDTSERYFVLNPAAAIRFVRSREDELTQITTMPPNALRTKISPPETAIYDSFFSELRFPSAAATIPFPGTKLIDCSALRIHFDDLDKLSQRQEICPSREIGDLRVLAVIRNKRQSQLNAISKRLMTAFICRNLPVDSDNATVVWLLAPGLGVVVWDRGKYGFEGPTDAELSPGLAFDLSARNELSPAHMAIPGANWQKFIADEVSRLGQVGSVLWPSSSGRAVPRADPSGSTWMGVFVRDFFVKFAFPIDATETLKRFFTTIEENARLEYGWLDSTGATWKIAPRKVFTKQITHSSLLWIDLTDFRALGAAGRVVSTTADIKITLPWLNQTEIEARGTLELSGSEIVPRFSADIGVKLGPGVIPGFKECTVRKIETDLKTITLRLTLSALPDLAEILPFLKTAEFEATAIFGTDVSDAIVRFNLSAPIAAQLYSRWAIVLRSAVIGIEKGQVESIGFDVSFDFGLAKFASVGGLITLRRNQSDGKFTFEISDVSGGGTIALGDFAVSLFANWVNRHSGTGGPIASDDWREGEDRDFLGMLKIRDGSIFERELKLALRIGGDQLRAFWVAALALEDTRNARMGAGSVDGLRLLAAHGADFKDGLLNVVTGDTSGLSNVIDISSGEIADDPTKFPFEWLKKWEHSPDIGSVLGFSGWFGLDEYALKNPSPIQDQRTYGLFVEPGMFRIDAVSWLLGLQDLSQRFALSIDTNRKLFGVGFDTAGFAFLEPNPKYVVDPGFLFLEFSYAPNPTDNNSITAHTDVGWPPVIPASGNPPRRDWSKATLVHIQDLWPINTLWGGYRWRIVVNPGNWGVQDWEVGIAVRAGWTWSYEIGGDLASARAEVGIALGGVIIFRQVRLGAAQLPPWSAKTGALDLFERTLQEIDALAKPIEFQQELYGDIWGSASATVLGIRVAGVSISAHVAFVFIGNSSKGLIYAAAATRVKFCVTIGCVTKCIWGSLEIKLVDRRGSLFQAIASADAASLLTVPGEAMRHETI